MRLGLSNFIKEKRRKMGKKIKIITAIILAVLTIFLRLNFIETSGRGYTDIDEKVYVPIASDYAEMMKKGDIRGIIEYQKNIEHPVFNKLIFAGAMIIGEKIGFNDGSFEKNRDSARMVSVAAAAGTVFLVSLVNPIAGIVVATSTWQIKYSSEVMFDSLVAFLGILSFMLYLRSKDSINTYFVFSAIVCGLAFATKYIAATIGIAIIVLFFMNKEKRFKDIFIYFVIAGAVFFLTNPILWTDSFSRITESLLFHKSYVRGSDVTGANYPMAMQLFWLIQSVPWHNNFIVKFDTIYTLGALFGIRSLFRNNKCMFVLFLVNAIFLLIYPTKWPQYTLIIIPVMGISFSYFIMDVYKLIEEKAISYKNSKTIV